MWQNPAKNVSELAFQERPGQLTATRAAVSGAAADSGECPKHLPEECSSFCSRRPYPPLTIACFPHPSAVPWEASIKRSWVCISGGASAGVSLLRYGLVSFYHKARYPARTATAEAELGREPCAGSWLHDLVSVCCLARTHGAQSSSSAAAVHCSREAALCPDLKVPAPNLRLNTKTLTSSTAHTV